MKQNAKTIRIIKRRVVGLVNPKLCFHYYSKDAFPSFTLLVDEQKVDYNLYKMIPENEYMLECAYDKDAKKVQLQLQEENKSVVVWHFRNTKLYRIMSKIENIMQLLWVKIKLFFLVLARFIKLFWREHHFLVPFRLWRKYFYDFRQSLKAVINKQFYDPFVQVDYLDWLSDQTSKREDTELQYTPLISILIPVYNVEGGILSACLDSILAQSYPYFEVCLADDRSTNENTIETLRHYEQKDARIKVVYREKNGHISAATNSALAIASGEFIALMDNDDMLDKDALYENVAVLNQNKEIDFLYSDEDKIDVNGQRCFPHFKPDYSPDTLLSVNYICHFSMIRKTLVEKVGGFALGLEGAQDYDLFLKICEQTQNVYHIPKILYHWRMIPGSTAASLENKDYAADKGKMAIENALLRRGIQGHVEVDEVSSYYRVVYTHNNPLVSIIIPTRNFADVTKRCLVSIYEKTAYKNFEILLVNNRSDEEEALQLFAAFEKQYDNFKVIDADMEFNYSKINNLAAASAKGEVLVLLNNDTEVISKDWLDKLVGYAMQKHIGTVGAKLLYPDMTVQHAGILLGLGGVASHAYIGSARESVGAYGRLRVPYNYSGSTAACLAIRKELYNAVGQLEEGLSVAYNDVDLNLKTLEAGCFNVCLPQVELLHHESKSRGLDTSSEKYKRFLVEQEFMYKKWEDKVRYDRFYNPNFSYKGWFMLDK